MNTGSLFKILFMGICLALGSVLVLQDVGVDLGAKGSIGVGAISAALGITLAAIATRGEGR